MLAAAGCAAATLSTVAGGAQLADDLAPRKVLWHFLPAEIGGALVAADGTCVYVAAGDPADSPTLSPDRVLSPGFRPLLLDRSGRLWCLAPNGAQIFGVKGAETFRLDAPAGASFTTTDDAEGVTDYQTGAFEDSAGRLWFGNSRGLQWFDGHDWRARDLADPGGLEVSRPMSTLRIVQAPGGRLYFWARWPSGPRGNRVFGREPACGTQGFWMFDGGEWSHYTVLQGLPDDRVEAVWPGSGDSVLVNTSRGQLVRFSTKKIDPAAEVARLAPLLRSDKWQVREEATESLRALGSQMALELKKLLTAEKDIEVRSRIRLILAALKQPGPGLQQVLESEYLCESIRLRPAGRDKAGGLQWLGLATGVTNVKTAQTFATAAFLVSAKSVRMIEDWPASDKPGRVSVLADGADGLWIGVQNHGLFHWDGARMVEVSDKETRGYARILGRDGLGRLILSNGEGVAAYWPGQPDVKK